MTSLSGEMGHVGNLTVVAMVSVLASAAPQQYPWPQQLLLLWSIWMHAHLRQLQRLPLRPCFEFLQDPTGEQPLWAVQQPSAANSSSSSPGTRHGTTAYPTFSLLKFTFLLLKAVVPTILFVYRRHALSAPAFLSTIVGNERQVDATTLRDTMQIGVCSVVRPKSKGQKSHGTSLTASCSSRSPLSHSLFLSFFPHRHMARTV